MVNRPLPPVPSVRFTFMAGDAFRDPGSGAATGRTHEEGLHDGGHQRGNGAQREVGRHRLRRRGSPRLGSRFGLQRHGHHRGGHHALALWVLQRHGQGAERECQSLSQPDGVADHVTVGVIVTVSLGQPDGDRSG
jgi:hypothetical protein